MRLLCAALLPALLMGGLTCQDHLFAGNADRLARADTCEGLADLLERPRDLPTTIGLAAIAGTKLPTGSNAQHELRAALQRAHATSEQGDALQRLRIALDDLVIKLSFEPLIEADVPAGFPQLGVVDELEIRRYPAYRMVQTDMRSGSNSAFWPLFQHIKSNDIAMTTPVQMDWQANQERRRPTRMAFLYGKPTTEPRETADNVRVVEVPAMTVLSLGAIGDDRRARIANMRSRLQAFLDRPGCRYEAAGAMRTMGYNSPMVSRERRYFEVQIPVRARSF